MSRFPVAGFDLSGVGFESERRESELWEAAVAAWLQLGSCAVSFQPVRGYSAPACQLLVAPVAVVFDDE